MICERKRSCVLRLQSVFESDRQCAGASASKSPRNAACKQGGVLNVQHKESPASASAQEGAYIPSAVRLFHQSRWLPEVTLSCTGPMGVACRRAGNCQTLRDVADMLREYGEEPGPAPDDPGTLLTHQTGTLGAKQALLAALAAECRRDDVQLILACHEFELPGDVPDGDRPPTLPLVVCYLRCRSRDVQITNTESSSVLHSKAVSSVRVEPQALAQERVQQYQRFAADWCRVLDVSAAKFARRRSDQLRKAARRSIVEDLLGYGLPPEFAPGR